MLIQMLTIYFLVEITDDFFLLYTLLKNFCVYICIMCGENSDCISFFYYYLLCSPPLPPTTSVPGPNICILHSDNHGEVLPPY